MDLSGCLEGWGDPATESGRVIAPGGWAEAVAGVWQWAATQDRSWWLMDADFARWPLGESGCVVHWHDWVTHGPHRRATLLALQWPEVAARHPRWVRWRQVWAHRVACLQLDPEEDSSLQPRRPTLVVEGLLGLRMLDQDRAVGVWSRRLSEIRGWQQGIDAISQRSSPVCLVSTLGL